MHDAQVKSKGARRITFTQFVDALALVAAKKGTPLADVAADVLKAEGPAVSGTKADYVKFHDDKVGSESACQLLGLTWSLQSRSLCFLVLFCIDLERHACRFTSVRITTTITAVLTAAHNVYFRFGAIPALHACSPAFVFLGAQP